MRIEIDFKIVLVEQEKNMWLASAYDVDKRVLGSVEALGKNEAIILLLFYIAQRNFVEVRKKEEEIIFENIY